MFGFGKVPTYSCILVSAALWMVTFISKGSEALIGLDSLCLWLLFLENWRGTLLRSDPWARLVRKSLQGFAIGHLCLPVESEFISGGFRA